jgi:hypothetical protein
MPQKASRESDPIGQSEFRQLVIPRLAGKLVTLDPLHDVSNAVKRRIVRPDLANVALDTCEASNVQPQPGPVILQVHAKARRASERREIADKHVIVPTSAELSELATAEEPSGLEMDMGQATSHALCIAQENPGLSFNRQWILKCEVSEHLPGCSSYRMNQR